MVVIGVDQIDLVDASLQGLIVNFQPASVIKKMSGALGLASGRHWKAISRIQGTFYDLDSEYQSPRAFGSVVDVIHSFEHPLSTFEGPLLPPVARGPQSSPSIAYQ